ncbi:hypothetical protein [Aureicoccus marinus]|nr:hypothetical protein [Aureicoccus marinus]
MKHYFGGIGVQLIYTINKNSLSVKYNCDFENCSEKNVYERKLSELESGKFISKIESLKPDTLNNEYINKHVLDGHNTEIYFGKLIETKKSKVIIKNMNLSVLDSMIKYVDELIPEKKFRLKTFGEE